MSTADEIRAAKALKRVEGKYLVDAATGCWPWQGKLDKDGYPRQIKVGSRTDGTRRAVRVHRWLCIETGIPLTPDLVPDHLCRNRACINPAHAEPVTRLVNHQRGLRAQRTHCKEGHAITGHNALKRAGGYSCRICSNEYQRLYQIAAGHKHANAYKARKRRASSESAIL